MDTKFLRRFPSNLKLKLLTVFCRVTSWFAMVAIVISIASGGQVMQHNNVTSRTGHDGNSGKTTFRLWCKEFAGSTSKCNNQPRAGTAVRPFTTNTARNLAQLVVNFVAGHNGRAAWNVFARLNTGIVGSNPARGMDVCVCSVFVFSCVGSGLAKGWSLVQGVLPTVYKCKITEPHKEEAKARYGLQHHIRRKRRRRGYLCNSCKSGTQLDSRPRHRPYGGCLWFSSVSSGKCRAGTVH
jgi:hypothetical protein